jgi:signal transduction histidine kinase
MTLQHANDPPEESILVLTPTGNDASIVASVLEKSGHTAEICQTLKDLCRRLQGAAGLILIAEEALDADILPLLLSQLQKQPAWSDIPIIILTASGASEDITIEAFKLFGDHGNINFLERPLRSITLISTIRAALRARKRQYQVRDLIIQQEKVLWELKLSNDELAKTNKELEEFAYVASHDLQEPLRTVSSYVDLLGMRYKGNLDQDANEFIEYAKDGAIRAQLLIHELLEYARIGTRGKPFERIDLDPILRKVFSNLHIAITESHAVIIQDPLPVILGDRVQMVQLFQNLISNALKFKGRDLPEIRIGSIREEKHWHFFVKDNGIGIDTQYQERIFGIFQRLNNRLTYPGTGIGLAICKKIVQRHGGKIWVESDKGQGSTFHFTLLSPVYNKSDADVSDDIENDAELAG